MNKMLWFDDKPSAKHPTMEMVARALSLKLIVNGGAEKVKDKFPQPKMWPALIDSLEESGVEIVFVDHCLTAKGKGGATVFKYGSTLGSILREKFHDVPIVGISAAGVVPKSECEEYVDFFDMHNLVSQLGALKSVVEGFRAVRTLKYPMRSGFLPIFRLLNAPEDQKEMIGTILPEELRGMDLTRRGAVLYKWMRNYFLRFSGVLVDPETIAARVGLKFDAFADVLAAKLKHCRYDGVFSSVDGARYWKSKTFALLAEIVKDDGAVPVAHYVDRLNVRSDKYAVCPICKKKNTEVIAYDELNLDRQHRHPAHWGCVEEVSIPIPSMYDTVCVLRGGGGK